MDTSTLPISVQTSSTVDYWSIVKRRWQPALCLFAGVCALNTINVLSKTPIYRAEGQLRLNISNETSQLVGLEALEPLTGNNSERAIMTEMDVMRSKPLLEKALSSIHKQLGSDDLKSQIEEVSILKEFLVVKPKPGTDIVSVAFEHSEPRVAFEAVNQLMQNYVNFNLQENRYKSIAARKFLAQELPQVRQNVLNADRILRQFMEVNQISAVENLADVVTTGQVNIQTQLDEVATQIAKVEAESINIRGQLGVDVESALDISAISQLPAIQETRQQLETVRQQLALAKSSLQPDHPTVMDLQDKQSQLQRLLLDSIRTTTSNKNTKINQQPADPTRQALLNNLVQLNVTRKGLLKQQQVLATQLNLYSSRSKQLPAIGQRLRQLQRELGVAETTYKVLLQSLQSAQLTENQTIPTAKVVELADLPTVPVAPNKFTEILRGVIAGALLAFGLAYFLEKVDTKLKTVDEIRDVYSSWPVLGSVPIYTPDSENLKALPTVLSPRSPVAEAYRMLQANLRFLKTDSPARVITLSSAVPREGKSWTTANLAVVLSQMNYRVLVIDADLRKPTQHQIWEVSNQTGLSNMLAAPEEDERKSMLETYKVQPNLELLTAGVIPPNPQVLIDSERFQSLLAHQAERYDYVLIDAPPLMVAADALIMAKAADGLLLVGRPESLEKSSAKRAKELLGHFGTDVLGLFINGIVTKNESYSYYYYSQNYYGESELDKKSSKHKSLMSSKKSSLR
ncbi:polysaccharide biosynthesis tyrosine autokinase [Acaryochloris sp. 'Moss Beach']|uniref:GumC family protein n=1 Tax=Acaryochloris sp. 'Moss Beach' TaxID=2740837 RepID=UPI001F464775|nr:polysaccharide biosynthesis tyrosine autokinase [Acaryochloris sp. 'Moss Beach']UJB69829.1 polysaccharide biosynthesis tyrosine autokinase [Acaryochloris sp. 'Moss Beach']